MKLSDLVAYRNALQLSLVQDSRAETTQRINILKHLVESRPEPTENVVAEFELLSLPTIMINLFPRQKLV